MFSAKVSIPSKKARLIYLSLSPDIRSDKNHNLKLELKQNNLFFEVRTKKLSHLRSILDSYLSLINMLEGFE